MAVATTHPSVAALGRRVAGVGCRHLGGGIAIPGPLRRPLGGRRYEDVDLATIHLVGHDPGEDGHVES